ncbi:hypothetical protein DNI29_02740 [Hymenobacter sediminis]|uniref:hypothetical protein n=1 Tax=Hymenobacter sediminis TaxID=2218621 RepID=UPI000DA686EC|nr:hypothetical protein [Hymenobacter sediminis]RPD49734.1 hypothetical protein DNI29_02740 [Hymenobacter sediminis]
MAFRLKRINWRLLGLHLLSVPFIVLGLRQLLFIRHVKIVRLRLLYGDEFWRHIDLKATNSTLSSLVSELYLFKPLAFLFAILIACSLLGLIAWRRRESLLLPFLLFVGGVLLNWTGLYSTPFVLGFQRLLTGDAMAASIYYRLAISGSLLVLIGMFPLLYTWRRPDESAESDPHLTFS